MLWRLRGEEDDAEVGGPSAVGDHGLR